MINDLSGIFLGVFLGFSLGFSLASLLFTTPDVIDNKQITLAIAQCEQNQGLKHLTDTKILCNNGAEFKFPDIKS